MTRNVSPIVRSGREVVGKVQGSSVKKSTVKPKNSDLGNGAVMAWLMSGTIKSSTPVKCDEASKSLLVSSKVNVNLPDVVMQICTENSSFAGNDESR